jgi:hypothetical protein
MKESAVEWYTKQILEYKSPTNVNGTDYILIPVNKVDFLQEQAKEMEKQQSYTYDEIRTIAYNAYCLGQLDEPTEGKYNLWIQQFKKDKL